ncbi:MAG: hypothetical protein DDT32_02302 [Syntrophomonadaceae bacterium]|nr:hypothetical protein [Bacillota bacterium]
MIAIGHFAIGHAAANIGLAVLRPKQKKCRQLLPILSGIWAMIPDTSKLIPQLEAFHCHWTADFFWLHRWIDVTVDPTDSFWKASAAIAIMVAGAVLAKLRTSSKF